MKTCEPNATIAKDGYLNRAFSFFPRMLFETEQDAINWYESQERVLTPAFLATIPWHQVKDHPLDPAFIPTLVYMRDVERLTSLYNDELSRTPTGKDPAIKRFMERWSEEEITHSDLLHRFLVEAGMPATDAWYDEVKQKISLRNRVASRIIPRITNLMGHHFTGVHMTWGAINELSTLTGYQRLWTLAKHPVLDHILKHIAREEATHSFFYWSVARIKLMRSSFRQQLARFIINTFWSPVGENKKTPAESNVVIHTLFSGVEGLELMHERVTRRIQQLPGLEALQTVTNRIASITHTPSILLKP